MKIGIIGESYLPRINGVSNSVDRVAKYLANKGHQVVVITSGKTDILYNRDFKIIRLNSITIPGIYEYDFPLVTSTNLKKIIQHHNFDIIHVASPFVLGYLALKVSKQLNIPSVAIYQTDVTGFAKFYGFRILERIINYWIAKVHKSADLNLVPSRWAKENLFNLGVRNMELWGRGVDVEFFNPIKRSLTLRQNWNSKSKIFIGYVGRLAPEKCIDNLKLIQQDENVQLIIIGDGPERTKLEKLLPEAIFTGRLIGEELATSVASLDILFATGKNETFCQVAQEALASGLYVFAPSEGATKELIHHGISGYIYNESDEFGINQQINTFLSYDELLPEIVKQNRNLVIGNTWESNGEKLYSFYLSTLKNFDCEAISV